MHIGSNQRITPAPNGGSAVGLNKQTDNPKETRGSLQAMNNFLQHKRHLASVGPGPTQPTPRSTLEFHNYEIGLKCYH